MKAQFFCLLCAVVLLLVLSACQTAETPAPTPTATETFVPTFTLQPTASPTPPPTETPTSVPTAMLTSTATIAPTPTPTPEPSPTLLETPTPEPTETPTPINYANYVNHDYLYAFEHQFPRNIENGGLAPVACVVLEINTTDMMKVEIDETEYILQGKITCVYPDSEGNDRIIYIPLAVSSFDIRKTLIIGHTPTIEGVLIFDNLDKYLGKLKEGIPVMFYFAVPSNSLDELGLQYDGFLDPLIAASSITLEDIQQFASTGDPTELIGNNLFEGFVFPVEAGYSSIFVRK